MRKHAIFSLQASWLTGCSRVAQMLGGTGRQGASERCAIVRARRCAGRPSFGGQPQAGDHYGKASGSLRPRMAMTSAVQAAHSAALAIRRGRVASHIRRPGLRLCRQLATSARRSSTALGRPDGGTISASCRSTEGVGQSAAANVTGRPVATSQLRECLRPSSIPAGRDRPHGEFFLPVDCVG